MGSGIRRVSNRLTARLSDQVYEQILRLIQRGEFPRHCKLPTETNLAERLGVSRPVVRTALARLRDQGIVRSQKGSGSFVERGPEPGALVFPAVRTVADLQRCYEFRVTVELQTAWLAAQRHTPDSLAAIEQALERVDLALSTGNARLGSDLNFAFHRAVARATHNPYFVTTLESIPNLIGVGRIGVRNLGLDDPNEGMRGVHAEHVRIYEAIRARDGDRARREMEAHIGHARQQVFERQELG